MATKTVKLLRIDNANGDMIKELRYEVLRNFTVQRGWEEWSWCLTFEHCLCIKEKNVNGHYHVLCLCLYVITHTNPSTTNNNVADLRPISHVYTN